MERRISTRLAAAPSGLGHSDILFIGAPYLHTSNRFRRVILLRLLAPEPNVSLLGLVCAKVDAAVVDVWYPDVAVDVELQVHDLVIAVDAGRNVRGRSRVIVSRESLESPRLAPRPRLVVEEADGWCW